MSDGQSRNKAPSPPGMVRSITSLDLRITDVSASLLIRSVYFTAQIQIPFEATGIILSRQ